ncbi:GGDEF domain-containing protein [Actinoplanes sp. NPDC023714]|uniref:GGDEF domain-containing protein n=1 Tax=Actinoplanes sp. NPDC023714 TaxID=3154322 RepID=UPI0033E9EA54
MFITNLVIATLAAAIGAGATYLAIRPTIGRLRTMLTVALWKLSLDPLTGLYNRTGLLATYPRITGTDGEQRIAVMLIDLDYFKDVNDTYGHDAGDHLLKTVAARFRELAESCGGIAARLAGDEFAIAIPLSDLDLHRTADLAGEMAATPVDIDSNEGTTALTITSSIGVAVVTGADPLEDTALRQADIAMYHAKRTGRNQYSIFSPDMTMPGGEARRGPRLRDRHRRDQGGAA